MAQEIKYKGQSVIPDDYSSPDGDLTYSLNLINEDGALKPIAQPSEVLEVVTTDARPSESKPQVYLHENSGAYKHYIILVGGRDLYWTDGTSARHFIQSLDGIRQVTTLGNTLCVLTADKIHYFLWKNNTYAYLGDHIPEIPLSFGLQGHVRKTTDVMNATDPNVFKLSTSFWPSQGTRYIFPKSNDDERKTVTSITSEIVVQMNQFIAESAKNGRFLYPFLVRYALRLYDGSLILHSAPVLMVPSTEGPKMFIKQWEDYAHIAGLNLVKNIQTYVSGLECDIDYQCLDVNIQTTFADWQDIVRSVDVFVSAPIYTYNQAGEVEGIVNDTAANKGYYSIASVQNNTELPQNAESLHAKLLLNPILANNYGGPTVDTPSIHITDNGYAEFLLPRHSDEYIVSNIRDCGTFYFLKSVDLKDIQTTRTKIDIPEDYLPSLNTREVMTDDYNSHDNITGNVTHIYNNRLNIADILRQYANPFNPATSVCYCDAVFAFDEVNNSYTVIAQPASIRHIAKVELKKNGATHHIKSKGTPTLHPMTPVMYYYYPSTDADYAVMEKQREANNHLGGTTKSETSVHLPLQKHLTLNGAVFFRGFDAFDEHTRWVWTTVQDFSSQPSTSDISDISIHEPNKIYLSEVENPFFFPVTHITTVGSSEILGLSAATQELSQGQFGQFPLYVFTREGTWALSVSDKGTYLAKQIITRDVCDNPESITALDKAVAFCTARGIMLMQGSQAVCISDTIAEEYPFEMSKLHSFNRWLNIQDFQPEPFSEFLKGCRMLYDYRHQHLIVFNGSLDKVVLREYDPDDPPVIIDPDNPPLLTPPPNGQPGTSGDIPSGNVTIYAYPPHFKYAYVYSFKSKMWGMMESQGMYETVKSYPDTLAVKMVSEAENLQKYSVVSFTERDSVFPPQLLLTRPLTFGATDTLKEVNTVIQRGFFQRGDLKTVLYGSRDLMNWHLISSSTGNYLRHIHGTSYKYFRIVGLSAIIDEHSIYGASVEAQARHTNRLR